MTAWLEHTNFTVSDAGRTAKWMQDLFGWRIRWQGPSLDGGRSLHVGTDTHYVALYQPARALGPRIDNYTTPGGLNHVGVVVKDLDAAEKAVKDQGFTPENHADYEPGRRFYFYDHDGIEFEVVQYD